MSDMIMYAVAVLTVSVKPTEDPNYCIIKYSADEKAGTLVRALKVFFVSSNDNVINSVFISVLIIHTDSQYIHYWS
jgi:hypothetical protein